MKVSHFKQKEARQNSHVKERSQSEDHGFSEKTLRLQIREAGSRALILFLDCVQDPHNLGAILRTAEAAKVLAVVSPKDKSVGVTETVRRVSVGGADLVPFLRVPNLARTMKNFQQDGLWLVGMSSKSTASIYDLDLRGPLGIVVGAEGQGLRRLTEDVCDHLVTIPMMGQIECLNVSVATGVCLFEAVRQRLPKISS